MSLDKQDRESERRSDSPEAPEEGDVKVPIEVEDDKNQALDPEEVEEIDEGVSKVTPVDDPEAEERARVEAAKRAGEELAERELNNDAKKLREERDKLQRELADISDQIEAAKKEAADATDRFVRLQADWDNYRRRTAAERLAEKERAAESLVCDLLPVLDDMERAIDHARTIEGNDQMQQFVDGIAAVDAKMLGILAKQNVEPIDPAGEPFDPLAHQAVGRAEDKETYADTVAQVYQKGYKMGGKVIRTAMVTVTYGGPKRPAEEPDSDGDATQDSASGVE